MSKTRLDVAMVPGNVGRRYKTSRFPFSESLPRVMVNQTLLKSSRTRGIIAPLSSPLCIIVLPKVNKVFSRKHKDDWIWRNILWLCADTVPFQKYSDSCLSLERYMLITESRINLTTMILFLIFKISNRIVIFYTINFI